MYQLVNLFPRDTLERTLIDLLQECFLLAQDFPHKFKSFTLLVLILFVVVTCAGDRIEILLHLERQIMRRLKPRFFDMKAQT